MRRSMLRPYKGRPKQTQDPPSNNEGGAPEPKRKGEPKTHTQNRRVGHPNPREKANPRPTLKQRGWGTQTQEKSRTQEHRHECLCHQTCYQPRVERRSFSSSCRTSMPGMASPSSSLASRTALASSKCVLALTMALARASGSLLLKMPEPTKMASAPSLRTSAASAGVAMPPAEKLGTGSLPDLAISRMRSSGAPSSLA